MASGRGFAPEWGRRDMANSIAGLGAVLAAALILGSSVAEAADPAPPVPAAGVPVCIDLPPSGEKLAGDMQLASEGHSIEVANGGGGDALVKIRHAETGKLAASFFLRTMETMTIEGVPDGSYKIQYAFGPSLAPDCKSFTRIIKANQLPETDDLKTQIIDDDEHTEVKRMSVSYQLSVSESANVKPVAIDAAAFNAD